MSSQNTILLSAMIAQLKNDIAPEMKNDDYFEVFSNEQILKEYDLSYDEIIEGTVGNGGDGGIDGFYIIVNDILLNADEELPKLRGKVKIDLFITQCKNIEAFDESVIQKFQSSAEDIFSLERDLEKLQPVYNSDLLKHVALFRNLYLSNISRHPELTIQYYYSSKGDAIHPNVNRKVESLGGRPRIQSLANNLFGNKYQISSNHFMKSDCPQQKSPSGY